MTQLFTDQIQRSEIYYAHIVALNFPIRHSTSCTKDVTVSQIHGNVIYALRHAPMSTSLIHICLVKVINEDLIISFRDHVDDDD